jgi:hypothetical protein
MEKHPEQLKTETHRAESGFQDAVKHYLLNPLETPEEFQRALIVLFESVTKYRVILDKLRTCLNAMRGSESFIVRQATIERAIVSLNTRDAALERLLKKISRRSVDHTPARKLTIRVP